MTPKNHNLHTLRPFENIIFLFTYPCRRDHYQVNCTLKFTGDIVAYSMAAFSKDVSVTTDLISCLTSVRTNWTTLHSIKKRLLRAVSGRSLKSYGDNHPASGGREDFAINPRKESRKDTIFSSTRLFR